MQSINWQVFKAKHEDARNKFELLCYHLFCRKLGVSDGAYAQFNHPGLETAPVDVDGELFGFQAKFFDHSINYQDIADSIDKALDLYPGLTEISIYVNVAGSETSKTRIALYERAYSRGVSIDWVAPSHFEVLLNQALNLDLAQFFFGVGTELNYILNEVDIEKTTLINSAAYLPLDIISATQQVNDLKSAFLQSPNRVSLLTGNPGAGKSLVVHKLFSDLIGLANGTAEDLVSRIVALQAMPILIDLKNCSRTSLESVLINRKSQHQITDANLKFIYLLDGLDELSERHAEETLGFVSELSKKQSTRKILISCRTSNTNCRLAKAHLHDLAEFQIADLKLSSLKSYFKVRSNQSKENLLNSLISLQHPILNSVVDILILRLFWESIEQLNSDGNVFDLFHLRVQALLDSPKHSKQLSQLNLPNPKSSEILKLNKEIALEVQQRFQLRVSSSELHKVVGRNFPKNDYKSINEINDYIAELFFDHDVNSAESYIYKHRRYHEYFLVRKMRDIYFDEPWNLRQLGVLANQDLLTQLFIPYLQSAAVKEGDVARAVDAGTAFSYVGSSGSIGNRPYYLDAPTFVEALVYQKAELFDEIMSDEQFNAAQKFSIDAAVVRNAFERLVSDSKDYSAESILRSIWEEDVRTLISNIRQFHEAGHVEFSAKLMSNFIEVNEIFREFGSRWRHGQRNLRDPIGARLEDWMYIKTAINGMSAVALLEQFIRPNLDQSYKRSSEDKARLMSDFFTIVLRYRWSELDLLAPLLGVDELEYLINLATKKLGLLKTVLSSPAMRSILETHLANRIVPSNSKISSLFLKAVLNIRLEDSELSFLRRRADEIINEREIDWSYRELNIQFVHCQFALKENSFPKLLADLREFSYFSPQRLYAALFSAGLELSVFSSRSLESIVEVFGSYINTSSDVRSTPLTFNISALMGEIVALGFTNESDIGLIRRILLDGPENGLSRGSLIRILFRENIAAYSMLVNDSHLSVLEPAQGQETIEFPDYVDQLLSIALYYSNLDPERARFYFYKAASEGTFRHGWRKDSIVAIGLVDALDLMWQHSLLRRVELREISKKILDLTLRVVKVTDGKGTWQGPRRLLECVGRHDHQLTIELIEWLVQKDYSYSDDIGVGESRLVAMIHSGQEYDEIESAVTKLTRRWNTQLNNVVDLQIVEFKIWFELALSPLHLKDERAKSFERALAICEAVHKGKVSLADRLKENEWEKFEQLCKSSDKEVPEFVSDISNKELGESVKESKYSEHQFVQKFEAANTLNELRKLFAELEKYENHIVLSNPESWKKLVLKTLDMAGSISPMLEYLDRSWYPRSDYFTANSRFFHFALGEMLKIHESRRLLLGYLATKGGHDGFINVLKSLVHIGDRQAAVSIFRRYVDFCELLVR